MVTTRKAKDTRKALGAAVSERRSSSRVRLNPATSETKRYERKTIALEPVTPTPAVELTDAEIEAALRHADALDTDVKRALVALHREGVRQATAQPREFALPFTPEEIKTIGHRKTVRHPPPFKRISKSVYLSTSLPVADLPVHKCNCFEDKAASSSTSRRVKPVEPAVETPKKRGRKPKAATFVLAPPPPPPVEIYCGEGCHNRMLFISCSPETCSVPDPALCSNRAIKRREAKPVRVEYVAGPGFGLFAEATIEPGAFVIEYVGEVIDDHECEQRLIRYRDQGEEHFYMLEIEKDVVIDARYRSNDARFINHSCDSNSMTQKWNVDGVRRIGIFARRRILAGEEITIDYNFSHFGDPMDCKCGSVACTGKLGLKRSDVQTKSALQRMNASKKTQEVFDAPPPEIKRPVQLSSLALLKSAKLDVQWLSLYGFKKRRLFVGHKKPEHASKLTGANATTQPSSSSLVNSSSSNSSPLSSEWSATTAEDMDATKPTSDWYNGVQRGDHLAEMRTLQSYNCGGKHDWTDDLLDSSRRTPVSVAAAKANGKKRLVSKRVGLLDARAQRFADLIAFANGASAWNKRVPSSATIDPRHIYRFIDTMKNGQLYLNHNLACTTGRLFLNRPATLTCTACSFDLQNDLNEDACHRCGLAGELICCDGCPAAFHLNCTNLAMLPRDGDPWFCSDCKRTARQRAQVEAITVATAAASASALAATSSSTADSAADSLVATGTRRQLRVNGVSTSTTAPFGPSLKRIFHSMSTKDSAAKRRPRKKMKSADKSYRLLEQMPLPAWDDDDDE